LVAAEDFPQAVTWATSIFQVSTIIGPMVGGLLYGLTGSPIPVYGCAAVAYLVSLGLFSTIRLEKAPERPRESASVKVVMEGLRYIWRNPLILGAISLDLFAVLLGGAVALLPLYAKEILRAGERGWGVLRGAPGAGAVITAIVLSHRP